jgi:hypothetical protein
LPVDLGKDTVREWEKLHQSVQTKLQLNQPLTANDRLIKAFLDNISRNDKKFEERNCYAE